MTNKLSKIYDFLLESKYYNEKFQKLEYKKVFCTHNNVEEKVISLLYSIINTQSQPKINHLSDFFQKIINDKSNKLNTFNQFMAAIGSSHENSYNSLYKNLLNNKGWGKKTSALFTKVIFNIHNNDAFKEFKLWDDTPYNLDGDKLYLPVDAVILDIFKKLGMDKPTFDTINKVLQEHYAPKEMILWDDLWFWGFINQKSSSSGTRETEWNLDKYWAIESFDKTPDIIKAIEFKSKIFRELIVNVKS